MAGEFLGDYLKNKLLKSVTHLGAPGRQGARLASSIAFKDLKPRDRQ